MKNGGDLFLQEIASREFMDNLVSILKMPVLNHDVKTKILRLIQNWALAFEGKPALGYVGEVYRTLQREGMSSVMVDVMPLTSTLRLHVSSSRPCCDQFRHGGHADRPRVD